MGLGATSRTEVNAGSVDTTILAEMPLRMGGHLQELVNKAQICTVDRLLQEVSEGEGEHRLLLRLAATGRLVKLLKRASDDCALDTPEVSDPGLRAEWHSSLERERLIRTRSFEDLLSDTDRLTAEMGDEQQQMEVVTLLQSGVEKYIDVLLPEELDVLAAVYEAVVRQANVIVGTLPKWFAASIPDGISAEKSPVSGSEGSFVRQMQICAALEFSTIRKFYGACHVSDRFVLHERSFKLSDGKKVEWGQLLGCAMAITHVHSQGFVHESLSTETLLRLPDGRGALSGLGLVRPNDRYLSESRDVQAFGLTIFNLKAAERKVPLQRLGWKLPETRPAFLEEDDWSLLLCMCHPDPASRATMLEATTVMMFLVPEDADNAVADEDVEVRDASLYRLTIGNAGSDLNVEEMKEWCGLDRSEASKKADEDFVAGEEVEADADSEAEEPDTDPEVNERTPSGHDDSDRGVSMPMSMPLGMHLIQQLNVNEINYLNGAFMQVFMCETKLGQLVRLAETGRFVQLLKRTIDSALDILKISEAALREDWHWHLRQERLMRVATLKNLLMNTNQLSSAMGDEQQQLEVLTMLQYGYENFGDEFIPEELDVMNAVYDAIVQQSNVVVCSLPEWFATSTFEWNFAKTSPVSGAEGACIQQLEILAALRHPHVRKFYGGCHVGDAFVVHERSSTLGSVDFHFVTRKMRPTFEDWKTVHWRHLLGCASGLAYVHSRGLVHASLAADNLCFVAVSREETGVLSGLGLLRHREGHAGELDVDQYPSVSRDILAFGITIFNLIAAERKSPCKRLGWKLPDSRPSFLNEEEWELLTGMCLADPTSRMSILDVMYKMEVLGQQETSSMVDDGPDVADTTVGDVKTYMVRGTFQTIGEMLQDVNEICREDPVLGINRAVYNRLVEVNSQLIAASEELTTSLVEGFTDILRGFFTFLDQSNNSLLSRSDCSSMVQSLCAAQTIANRHYNVHQAIDRLILHSPILQPTASVHLWQPTWEEAQKLHRRSMESCLADPSPLLNALGTEGDRAEAVLALQFEARNHPHIQSSANLHAVDRALAGRLGPERVAALPKWVIPVYQVELGSHIAEGSFGTVSHGKWLGTNVVVKLLFTNQVDRQNRDAFRREADIWFELNHANLIKLLGACHEGRPFFVCEPANEGTIVSYLREKNLETIWVSLLGAAKGLQHLHDRGIVHGDLKGNNILVCGNDDLPAVVKLADFGLSVYANREPSSSEGALGAFRWKAPECLRGEGPTLASDMFAFGMCVIEVVSGEMPWGNEFLELAVKGNVVKKLLPMRPECFTDREWDLVERMCCFEPKERIGIGAAVVILDDIQRGYQQVDPQYSHVKVDW